MRALALPPPPTCSATPGPRTTAAARARPAGEPGAGVVDARLRLRVLRHLLGLGRHLPQGLLTLRAARELRHLVEHRRHVGCLLSPGPGMGPSRDQPTSPGRRAARA